MVCNRSTANFEHQSFTRGRDFVEPIAPMNDITAAQAERGESLRNQFRRANRERADHLDRGSGGVSERPQQVECGAHFQLLSSLLCALHGGMNRRREHESDARLTNALADLLRREHDIHAQPFEDIGAAAQAGQRSVPVFCDLHAGARANNRGHC